MSGLLLANLFSIAGLVMLHKYLSRSNDTDTADRTIMLMLAFPGAIFLLFPYSEPLFLLLSVGMCIFLSEERLPPGRHRLILRGPYEAGGSALDSPFRPAHYQEQETLGTRYTILSLLGYNCYLAVMYVSTGNAFAGFASQDLFFSHASIGKLFDPAGFIRMMTMPPTVHSFVGSAIDRAWFVFFLLSLFPLWKNDKVMFSYALVMGLVPALTLSLMAFTRYSLMLIPSFIVAADFFAPDDSEGLFYITLAALFGIQVIFLIRHINFCWVG